MATMMVLADINTAPIAGVSSTPHDGRSEPPRSQEPQRGSGAGCVSGRTRAYGVYPCMSLNPVSVPIFRPYPSWMLK